MSPETDLVDTQGRQDTMACKDVIRRTFTQRLLPALSVYLGHINVASTQVYLTMTPELLQQANARFEHYARKETADE
jgi:hypothetical protein